MQRAQAAQPRFPLCSAALVVTACRFQRGAGAWPPLRAGPAPSHAWRHLQGPPGSPGMGAACGLAARIRGAAEGAPARAPRRPPPPAAAAERHQQHAAPQRQQQQQQQQQAAPQQQPPLAPQPRRRQLLAGGLLGGAGSLLGLQQGSPAAAAVPGGAGALPAALNQELADLIAGHPPAWPATSAVDFPNYARPGPFAPARLPLLEHTCVSLFPLCSDNRCVVRLQVLYPRGGSTVGLKVRGCWAGGEPRRAAHRVAAAGCC